MRANPNTMPFENLLKSIFIGMLPFLALYLAIDSSIRLVHDFSFTTLSLWMASMTIVCFFSLLFLFKRARTDENLKAYSLTILFSMVLSMYGYVQTASMTKDILLLALVVVAWAAYVRWYSRFSSRDKTVLKVGQSLPPFEIKDIEQNQLSSQDFKGHMSLLLFYRGNWCPLCMAQIKEVAQEYQQLAEMGVKTYLISPQSAKHSSSLSRKFKLDFKYLVDTGNKVAKQLGIYAQNGLPMGLQVLGYDSDTVLPTVLILDKEGKIIFADLTDNYRVRPEPATFMKIIQANLK